jgi:hypothetical protein
LPEEQRPSPGSGRIEEQFEEVSPDEVLPAVEEPRVLEPRRPAALPAVVGAAGVGFLAGVVAWTLVRVLRRSGSGRAVRALRRRRTRGLEIAGSRSFLVDVHLLKR